MRSVSAAAGDATAKADYDRQYGSESEIDVVVDVSDLAARKRAAVTAHRSEIDRSRAISGFMSLPDDIQEKLLGVECYQRRDLVPGGCDLI